MSLQILQELTSSVRSVSTPGQGGVGARGRYARTPEFASAAAKTTRPPSDRGVTFHFQHKAISKRSDSSETATNVTSAAPHQAYIERANATDTAPDFNWPGERMLSGQGTGWTPEDLPGSPELFAPKFYTSAPQVSFGTTGASRTERQEFWRLIERSEGRVARVQNRIISEIPHELTQHDRIRIARDFCRIFEENGLPYWASLHAPSKSNDPRNHHLHICYHDRPSARTEDGTWDFSIREKRKKKNRQVVYRRPWKRVKPALVRARSWVKTLRRRHADICNFYLSKAGLAKRYDARSYRESGVAKTPTEHLGNVASAFESFGLETTRGVRNARREIAWRLHQARAPWAEMRAASGLGPDLTSEGGEADRKDPGRESPHLLSSVLRDPENPVGRSPDSSFASVPNEANPDEISDLIAEGERQSVRSAMHEIAADILTMRARKRRKFLQKETRRLAGKEDISSLGETAATISNLTSEAAVIEVAMPDLEMVSSRCRSVAAHATEASDRINRQVRKMINRLADNGIEIEEADARKVISKKDSDIGKKSNEADDLSGKKETEVAGKVDGKSAGPERLSREEAQIAADLISPNTDQTGGGSPETTASRPARDNDKTADEILQDAISTLTGDRPETTSGKTPRKDANDASIFPGSIPVGIPKNPADIEKLERKLVSLDNRAARRAAIATRDATDLCPQGHLKEDLNRGWVVLRAELQRRGVDLETGRHDPMAATDPKRARLHLDQDDRSPIDIQKELERQRLL